MSEKFEDNARTAPWLSSYGEVQFHLDYPDFSISDALFESARKYPQQVALTFQDKDTTYAKLVPQILEAEKAFKAIGIKEGDVVTVCMPNTPQTVVCLYAINAIGAIASMIHPLSAIHEIAFYLKEAGSRTIISLDQFYGKLKKVRELVELDHMIIARISDALSPVKCVAYRLLKERKFEKFQEDGTIITWKHFLDKAKTTDIDPSVKKTGADLAVILFSGGTTGVTKGIKLSNLNFNALAMQTGVMCVQSLIRERRRDLRDNGGNVCVKRADARHARFRRRDVREVDAVRDVPVEKVVFEFASRHDGAVVLGLLGGSAEVRDRYRVRRVQDLLGREVGDVRGHFPAFERRDQFRGVDEVGAREVDELHAVFHLGDARGIDHSLGVGSGGNVQGHIVGNREDVVKRRRALHAMVQVPCARDRKERIAPDNFHAKVDRNVRDQTADGAQTDDAERLARELGARELRLALFHLLGNVARERFCPFDAADHVARGKQQRANGKFAHTVGIRSRGVEYHDALFAATVNGNVVHARARSRDGFEFAAELHFVHDGGTNHDAVGVLDVLTDLIIAFELVQTHLRDLIEQLNFHFHIPLRYALGFSAANFFMNATSASTPS